MATKIASVTLPTSKPTLGEACLIPILLLLVSTLRTLVSIVKSPVTANEVNVPTLVTLACAAVCNVPVKLPEKPVDVNNPVDGL